MLDEIPEHNSKEHTYSSPKSKKGCCNITIGTAIGNIQVLNKITLLETKVRKILCIFSLIYKTSLSQGNTC